MELNSFNISEHSSSAGAPKELGIKQQTDPRDEILKTIWAKGNECRTLTSELNVAKGSPLEAKAISKQLAANKLEIGSALEALRILSTDNPPDHLQKYDHLTYTLRTLALVKNFISHGEIKPVGTEVDLTECYEPMMMIEKLIENYNGVCIGEHHDDSALKYLLNHSDDLTQLGINTFFLEGFRYKDQAAIDSYLKGELQTRDGTQITKENLLILNAAKNAGIRIVGLDSGLNKDGIDRLLKFNLNAKDIIHKEQNGKFIALMGAAHLTSCYGEAVPGVAELSKTPAIEILKNKDTEIEHIQHMNNRYSDLRTPPLGISLIEIPKIKNNYDDIQSVQSEGVSAKYASFSVNELLNEIWKLGDQTNDLELKLRQEMHKTDKQGVENISDQLKSKRSEVKTALDALRSHQDKDLPLDSEAAQSSVSFVKNFISQGDVRPVQMDIDLSNYKDPVKKIEIALHHHEGVTLSGTGEIHTFLLANPQKLKEMGVETLFLENFLSEDQKEIDMYLKGDKDPFLIKHSDFPQSLSRDYLVKLLDASKEAGIRIVGIDCEQAKNTLGSERSLLMNQNAKEVIANEKTGKFITFVTPAHITSCLGDALPGVAELTRTPSIEIYQNIDELNRTQMIMVNRYGDLRNRPTDIAVLED